METLTSDDINRLQELVQEMLENSYITSDYREKLQRLDDKLADILGEIND